MKRMKLAWVVGVAIFICGYWSAYAVPVSVEEAEQYALNWFLERDLLPDVTSAVRFAPSAKAVPDIDLEGTFHVINIKPSGYAIIAADDVAYPVLFYTTRGQYTGTDLPPQFAGMLRMAKLEVQSAIANNVPQSQSVAVQWRGLKNFDPATSRKSSPRSVDTLLSTRWDQVKYYNKHCPADVAGPDGHVVAGCVATAMAQLMKFHGWPERGIGSHSYTHAEYGTISANFGVTQYDYGAMPDSLTDYNDEVARLLFHCGVAVDMYYGTGSSGANMPSARNAMVNYFGYEAKARAVGRSLYSGEEWTAILRDNLDNDRPVFYKGNADSGGHAFILDGYQGAAHFHVNWGWSGAYDGYFYLNDLTPGSYSFNDTQGAILDLMPDNAPISISVRVNGEGTSAIVGQSDPVTVSVKMNAGAQYTDTVVDWWLIVVPRDGAEWYYLHSQMSFMPVAAGNLAACQPVHTGPLMQIAEPLTVLDSCLPPGVYDFYFAVTYPPDGALEMIEGQSILDSVTVMVVADPPSPGDSSSMALIPGGYFTMGNTFSSGMAFTNEKPVCQVYLSAFYMEKHEVTKALWDEVYDWAVTNGYSFVNAGKGKASTHPLHTINWYDVVKWCNARSEKDGLTPAYYTDSSWTTVYRTGQIDISNDCVDWEANGYRLPTEAEWEKAARGGLSDRRFPWDTPDTISHQQANFQNLFGESYATGTTGYHPVYNDGTSPFTSPVGAFEANRYGLYDMAGNVSEWCWEWFDENYYSWSPGIDPRGPPSGTLRVSRGGSWYSSAVSCRVSARNYYPPEHLGGLGLGFRCARSNMEGSLDPTPSILANGQTGTVMVDHSEKVHVTIGMDAGGYAGTPMDWWVVIAPSSGAEWYYLDSDFVWKDFTAGDLAACRPVFFGGLRDIIEPMTIWNNSLPDGTYDFHFAVESPMDGVLDMSGWVFSDQVTVVVGGEPDPEYNIVGEWGRDGAQDDLRFVFNQDNTWLIYSDNPDDGGSGTYTISGNTLRMIGIGNWQGESIDIQGTIIDNNTIIMNNPADGTQFTLIRRSPGPDPDPDPDPPSAGDYMIIDVSGGPSASSYPVSYLTAVPSGGWTDEYKTTKIVLRKIPAGTFTMGSPTNELGRWDELTEPGNLQPERFETQHQVTLTKDFYIGAFQITQKQWERVIGNWPSYFNNPTYRDTRPVEQVSYADIRGSYVGEGWPANNNVDASSFMGKLRARTGLTTLDLPTEAQWEYACRAGTTTALNSGKNLTTTGECPNMSEVGRYNARYGSPSDTGFDSIVGPDDGTALVGSYQVNAWGLFDMHGNVMELCLDHFVAYTGATTDPVGNSSAGVFVVRGGYWFSIAMNCRSANRGPGRGFADWGYNVGFRLARTLP